MAIVNSIIATIASLSNIPMTLESGLSWDRNMTHFLMKNSPFFIRLTAGNGVEFVTANGDWLVRTTTAVEAKRIGHDTMYFVTTSGHKYILCIDPDYMEKLLVAEKERNSSSQFPLSKPEKKSPVLYNSFEALPYKVKEEFWNLEEYEVYNAAHREGKFISTFYAKRPDYGFVGNVFAHISDCADGVSDLTKFNGDEVVGEIVSTNRGEKLVNYTFDLATIKEYEKKAEEYFLAQENKNALRSAEFEYEREMKFYNSQKDIWGMYGFCAINSKMERQNRAYMDDKTETTFAFSRSITKEEFISFLNVMGYEMKEPGAWYENYSTVSGNGNTWTYTWVRPSTH